MDWSRAKTILILSFLLLNSLLAYQLWVRQSFEDEAIADYTVLADEMNKLLESKQIKLETEVPETIPKLQQITIRFDENLKGQKTVNLEKPVKLPYSWNRSGMREIMKGIGVVQWGDYTLDGKISKDGLFLFHQMYAGYPMFNVILEITSQQGEITSFRQGWARVELDGAEKAQRVISAFTAVRTLAENYLGSDETIADVSLGYHGQRFDSEMQYLLPAWRIVLGDGEIYYVQAFTGAVEQ